MDQKTYDALVAAKKAKSDWPSKEEAAIYLATKGYDGIASGGVTLPNADHKPTAKQLRCLEVLGMKAIAPKRVLNAEPGKHGSA